MATSEPESGVRVIVLPLISLTAPIRRFALGACCICAPEVAASPKGIAINRPPTHIATSMIRFVLMLMKCLFFLIYTAGHDKIRAFTKFYFKINGCWAGTEANQCRIRLRD